MATGGEADDARAIVRSLPEQQERMIFFYEMMFVAAAVATAYMAEAWNRGWAVLFVAGWFGLVVLGKASFDARLADPEPLPSEERRWFLDARDGLRHLRLLFGLTWLGALAWWLLGELGPR